MGNFHWYSNPQIGYKHVTDPSKKPGSPTPGKKWGKSVSKKSYPF